MHMVGNPSNPITLAARTPHNRRKIGMKVGLHGCIKDRHPFLRAEDHMNQHEPQSLSHTADYRSGLQPSNVSPDRTSGFTPGWYIVASSALVLLPIAILLPFLLVGCKSSPAPAAKSAVQETIYHYPPRPTVPPPPVKLLHQDQDTLTLTTKPDATDDEIAAILWQFRDAAHNHTFDTLHLPQKFIDARQPSVWFHVYRGSKCAAEKFIKGKLPCEASYHGAGDYTLGAYKNPQWEDAVLHNADGTETHLWDADAPPTKQ
jgi:hypothetical protein